MAFSRVDQSRLFTAAQARLSAVTGSRSAFNLAGWLRREYPGIDGGTQQAYAGIAQRALRGYESGAAFNRTRTRVPVRADVPIDPGIMPDEARYRYRVVLRFERADGSEQRHMVEVDSNELLSRAQAVATATEQFGPNVTPSRSGRQQIRELGSDPSVIGATIISIGRRQ